MNTKTIFAVLKNPKDYRYHAIGMPINIKELIGRDITDEEIKEMTRKCSRDNTITCGALKVRRRTPRTARDAAR
jgi:hypothetical protein